jgi:hypothetical protein
LSAVFKIMFALLNLVQIEESSVHPKTIRWNSRLWWAVEIIVVEVWTW